MTVTILEARAAACAALDIFHKTEVEYALAKDVNERQQSSDSVAAVTVALSESKDAWKKCSIALDVLSEARRGDRLTVIKGIVVTTSKTTPDDLVKIAEGHAAMKQRYYRKLRLR